MMRIIANRYTIDQKIGSGGMGDVFQGIDQRTNTPVAVKVLKSDLSTPEMVARFIREGEALRRLNHPNIVMLLDAIEENDQHYLIMELVEGGALDEILNASPPLPIKRVLNIALDLADALTRAHRLNVIHRDIKPANVLIAKDGMPRLTDFGIAHTTDSEITQPGTVMGTVAYIAPEVLQGDPADARSDIWSFGIVLYEMLAGTHPFKAATPALLIQAVLSHPLPDLEAIRPDAPAALVDLINRMMMRNPAERIPRMRLVGAELEALLAGEDTDTGKKLVSPLNALPSSRFATPSPSSDSVVLPNNLPVQTTPFVGREHELAELARLLADKSTRLVTVLGPGGMGKTRLSLELAGTFVDQKLGTSPFEHGIFFVDLAPITSDENIVQTIGDSVGYAFQSDGREPAKQLLDYLREKNMLLLMDNFEHVIAGRSIVQNILQSAPSVKILATSREKLNLNAETVFILGGMEFPEWETPEDALEYGAVKLFMQSARRVRADFELQAGDLAYVARICRMVYGTPLGILLAAAWLETLSPAEIGQELSASLDFLETEMHDVPERQRSLRAVFEYSWNLLTADERTLFAQFSIFRGGFTREAAQQITGATLRTLTVMINKSLLRRENTSGRYEIHELLRQYAQEKLGQPVDNAPLYDAHCRYYSNLVTQLTPKLKGQGQLAALSVVETDFENIRAAWTWAVGKYDTEIIGKSMEGLYQFLMLRNRFMDGLQLFSLAREVWNTDGENPPLLAGQVLVRYPNKPSPSLFRRGLAIAQAHNNTFEIAFCQRLLGHWLSHTEFNQVDGIPELEASLRGFEKFGDKFYIAQTLDDLGWSYNLNMERTTQQTVVKRSLDLRRELGDKIGTANSLRNLGGAMGGFFDTTGLAINYWREAKAICLEMNDRLGIAWNASLQAANLILMGEFETAQPLLDEAYPHAVDINDPIVKGFILILKGILLALRDEDYEKAKGLIEEGFPRELAPDFRMIIGPMALVVLSCASGEFRPLQPYLQIYLNIPPFNQQGFYVPALMPCCLVSLTAKGQYVRAAELIHAYLEHTMTHTGDRFPMEWAKHWGLLARLRGQLEKFLGPAPFQAAWERGAHITMEEMADEIHRFVETEV